MVKQAVLSLIFGGILLGGCAAVPTAQTESQPMGSGTTSSGNDSLQVRDQINGTSITIDSATLEKQGFVMLLKTDTDGNPTDMVGVSEAFTGSKTNIPIELMETYKSGDKLYAMLHTDANTNEKFEWPGPDEPINDAEGIAIMQQFTLK